MGASRTARYTLLMPGHDLPDYQCGELRVSPALGLVSNGHGESIRLGLVNMKVLHALLAQPGRIVGRGELFGSVWPNQSVSDDALTRCVSDIRGQLRKLSGRDDWIETLPKRGYRWIGEVSEAAAADPVAAPMAEVAPLTITHPTPMPDRVRNRVLRLVGRGIAYLVALIVLASVVVWVIDRVDGPRAPVVAVLPVTSGPSAVAAAAGLERALRTWLAAHGEIRVLARSAIDARPANPFPYFYYELGARWVVEAGLQESVGQVIVTVAVADAQTGIVEMQYSERATADRSEEGLFSGPVRQALDEFFESQLRR